MSLIFCVTTFSELHIAWFYQGFWFISHRQVVSVCISPCVCRWTFRTWGFVETKSTMCCDPLKDWVLALHFPFDQLYTGVNYRILSLTQVSLWFYAFLFLIRNRCNWWLDGCEVLIICPKCSLPLVIILVSAFYFFYPSHHQAPATLP